MPANSSTVIVLVSSPERNSLFTRTKADATATIKTAAVIARIIGSMPRLVFTRPFFFVGFGGLNVVSGLSPRRTT